MASHLISPRCISFHGQPLHEPVLLVYLPLAIASIEHLRQRVRLAAVCLRLFVLACVCVGVHVLVVRHLRTCSWRCPPPGPQQQQQELDSESDTTPHEELAETIEPLLLGSVRCSFVACGAGALTCF